MGEKFTKSEIIYGSTMLCESNQLLDSLTDVHRISEERSSIDVSKIHNYFDWPQS